MYKKDQRKRVDWHIFNVLWNRVFKHAKFWDFHKKLYELQIHNNATINLFFSDFYHYFILLKCTCRRTHRGYFSFPPNWKQIEITQKIFLKKSINCSKQFLFFLLFLNFVFFMGPSIKYSPKQPAFFIKVTISIHLFTYF